MKIAFIVHDYHRSGGHSRYVAELATRFSGEHEVHVYANRFDSMNENRVIFHRVPALRTNVMTTLFTFAISSSLSVGKRFDIVHSQGFCGPTSNVITTHICNEAWAQSLARFVGGLTARERIFNFLATRLERSLYRRARGHVIAISKRVAQDIKDCYQCEAPMHLIYHGVDLETFSPWVCRFREARRRELSISASGTVFLFVGDLRKGANQCIRALARSRDSHLVLVTRSNPAPHRKVAREACVENRVHFCGSTDRVEEFYGAADTLLLPSPYDAFGMVAMEAMACGLPVIVSREAGVAELIRHNVNGLLLDGVTDEEELARHMISVQANPEFVARLGQSARTTAERFSWDKVADETMRVYMEVARRN